MRSLVRRWWPAVLIAVCGVWFAVANLVYGRPVAGLVVGVVLLAVAWVLSPLLFPRGPGWVDGAARSTAAGVPLILWKPNCTWCIRLRIALGLAGRRAVWVDIERDREAAAETRFRNDGNETTPTVVARRHPDEPAPVLGAETARFRPSLREPSLREVARFDGSRSETRRQPLDLDARRRIAPLPTGTRRAGPVDWIR